MSKRKRPAPPSQQEIDALRDSHLRIGMAIARKVFERRGNRSEAHLSEGELAGICAVAADDAVEEFFQREHAEHVEHAIAAELTEIKWN